MCVWMLCFGNNFGSFCYYVSDGTSLWIVHPGCSIRQMEIYSFCSARQPRHLVLQDNFKRYGQDSKVLLIPDQLYWIYFHWQFMTCRCHWCRSALNWNQSNDTFQFHPFDSLGCKVFVQTEMFYTYYTIVQHFVDGPYKPHTGRIRYVCVYYFWYL